MSFLHPIYLYGLFAILIPIIIHLFNFRRYKKIYFPNVRFLEEVKQKTKRKSNIKHLLVLFSRILTIAALVIAFSQPYIPVDNQIVKKGKSLVCIYLDNSFSMAAESEKGILIETAKNYSREIIESYAATDDFCFISNDFKGIHQRIVSKEDADEFIINTEISPSRRTISEVLSRISAIIPKSEAENKIIYVISDFQKNICDFDGMTTDTMQNIFFIPLSGIQESNVFIDSCWFDSPVQMKGQQAKLKARIVNNSETPFEQYTVNLFLNEEQAALASISVGSNSDAVAELPFTLNKMGISKGYVQINDHPITYDNKFYISFKVNEQIDVLTIYQNKPSKYLNSLFQSDSLFNFSNMDVRTIDFASFTKTQLIILNGLENISSGLAAELEKFVTNGGSLLIFPAKLADLSSYNQLLRTLNSPGLLSLDTLNTEVNHMNIQHEIFADVFEEIPQNIDLPKVNEHFTLEKKIQSGYQQLLSMLNGNSLMTHQDIKKGKLYLSTVGLNTSFSNFAEHSIFVPMMYKIAFLSNTMPPLFYELGQENNIIIKGRGIGSESIYKITKNPDFEVIPSFRNLNFGSIISIGNEIKEAGNYALKFEGDVLQGLAFNYKREESKMQYFSTEEFRELLRTNNLSNIKIIDNLERPLSQTIKRIDEGIPLWKWFIIAALLFLAMEIALLRLL